MGKRQGIMLATPFTERHFKDWQESQRTLGVQFPKIYAQLKLNGERLKWQRGQLLSSEANPVELLPHILDELMAYFPNTDLDGEGYCHGWSRQTIHSVISRTACISDEYEAVQYHVFDTPSQATQVARFSLLEELEDKFSQCRYIKLVKPILISSVKEAQNFVAQAYASGYEGGIFRNPLMPYYEGRSVKYMMKWKPKREDTYLIVDLLPGKGKYEGTLGALVVKGTEENAQTFHVGSFAVSDQERDYMWKNRKKLLGARCTVRFTELTDAGIPPSSTFICLIDT